MKNLTIKNKTALRNRILNSEGNTDSLNDVHFYVEGNKITWDVYGSNDNLNGSADSIMSLSELSYDSEIEDSSKKSMNEAITRNFKKLEQSLIVVFYADYTNNRVVKTNIGELSDYLEILESKLMDDEFDCNGCGLVLINEECAINNLAEHFEMTEEEKSEIEIVKYLD